MKPGTPELEFPGGRLVPFCEEHLSERYVSWLNDPDVVRYSELRHTPQTHQSCVDYSSSLTKGGHFFWAIETSNGDRVHVGNIVAYVDHPNLTANLTILVGEKRVWGKGTGAAAWATALSWLLNEGGMRKVTAGTMSCNKAMLRLMEKSGMKQEARLNAQLMLDNQTVDVIMASKLSQTNERPAFKDENQ